MKSVSMLEFRNDAEAVVRMAQMGKRMILTYRGRPVMRLEPIDEQEAPRNDRFYSLAELSQSDMGPLTNPEIDHVLYT